MKYIILFGSILAFADAIEIILNENGTRCLFKCGLEPNKSSVSYDSSCTQYVQCLSAESLTILSCYGDSKFDDETRQCIPTNGTETPVCHPCAGLPPYVPTASDCPVLCRENLGKNMSHSFDCKTYKVCTNETVLTFEDCPNNQTFSDAVGACVPTVEGSDPTCHPCMLSDLPVDPGQNSTAPTQKPPNENSAASTQKPKGNSAVHERVDLITSIVLIFIAMIVVF